MWVLHLASTPWCILCVMLLVLVSQTEIYLDDCDSGDSLVGNVFYRAGRAAFIGGGRDNLVENNLMIECDAAVHLDARGTSRIKLDAAPGDSWNSTVLQLPGWERIPIERIGLYNDDDRPGESAGKGRGLVISGPIDKQNAQDVLLEDNEITETAP